MNDHVRVLIADDQSLVRAGLRAILETADGIEVVAEAGTGEHAVAEARQQRPDVALLDIQMPRLSGLDAARQILTLPNPPRVVMLTTFDLDEYVYEAMRIGASGFLIKDTPREQLIAVVRTVLTGDAILSSATTRRLVERFLDTAPTAAREVITSHALSDREVEVWRAVARGLSNAEIAAELFVSDATIKTHVARILAKLNLRDRAQAIIAAYETGLIGPRGS